MMHDHDEDGDEGHEAIELQHGDQYGRHVDHHLPGVASDHIHEDDHRLDELNAAVERHGADDSSRASDDEDVEYSDDEHTVAIDGITGRRVVEADDLTGYGGFTVNEPAPNTIYYRQDTQRQTGRPTRPTIADLHSRFTRGGDQDGTESLRAHQSGESGELPPTNPEALLPAPQAVKMGWIKGVLMRCIINIWGVMLFIRLSWVVGQAGIGLAVCIILLSTAVTMLTTVSMSAICTNGEVRGGGAYYLISRSLGPEFGGAIGLLFSFANAVAVAMYIMGFSETLFEVLEDSGHVWFGRPADLRIYSVISTTVMLGISLVGAHWESRVQLVMLGVLIVAILAFMIGTFIGPQNQTERDKGFIGYSGQLFKDNWGPDFEGETFFSVFAIFFPAATGILAGANMSGDLKDAQKAIPKGTFFAIIITSIVYIAVAVMCGSCVLRVVPGSTMYGLLYNYNVVALVSAWSPLVIAGIFSATLSSALVSLVSAPRVFQAVCKDNLFPYTGYFAKGSGPSDDPKRGYFLAYFIAIGFVLLGDLNQIAPIMSNFFLMSYALINYSCFAASMAKSPGWRPAFRYYNKWLSLVGCVLCLLIMFIVNWLAALITLLVVAVLYKYVEWMKPDANWGSASQAQTYVNALSHMLRLSNTEDHVKNYRPQMLVMSGPMSARGDLVRFAGQFCKRYGMVMSGHVVIGSFEENIRDIGLIRREQHGYVGKTTYFPEVAVAPSLRAGLRDFLLIGGLGKMRPNTALFGWKYGWQTRREEVDEYVGMLSDCFQAQLGVMLVRAKHYPGPDTGITEIPLFREAHRPAGHIDVWWLVDDGGLTILIPWLLTQSAFWSKCKLRVLTVGGADEVTTERLRMARLLRKFRIQAEVVVIPDINRPPRPENVEKFVELGVGPGEITEKTKRQVRMAELLQEHSSDASLVVMTLPVPHQNTDRLLYMGYLEILTRNLPMTCLIRGNQQSVLTFYS